MCAFVSHCIVSVSCEYGKRNTKVHFTLFDAQRPSRGTAISSKTIIFISSESDIVFLLIFRLCDINTKIGTCFRSNRAGARLVLCSADLILFRL